MSEWIRVETAIRIVQMIGICATSVEAAQAVLIESFHRVAESEKPITNADRLRSKSDDDKKRTLIEFFNRWADIGDSYIYDLTRVKSAFDIGTMSLEDLVEWDESRVTELVDEFINWLKQPVEEDV